MATEQPRPDRRSHADVPVTTVTDGVACPRGDSVVVEEPLTVRVRAGDEVRTVAVTMRTPGSDLDLARGFLWTEGVLTDPTSVLDVAWCDAPTGGPSGPVGNTVTVTVAPPMPDLDHLHRHGSISSACGVCGRTTIDDLARRVPLAEPAAGPVVAATVLTDLPQRLRAAQHLFATTGGLHAAARFRVDGTLVDLREDVGRHNALDKLVGAAARLGDLDWRDDLILLSGRASWELLQKAVTVQARIVAAVGAPSSLAVEVADRFGITLAGFVRDGRFNLYTHPHRVAVARPREEVTPT